ncbi:hypothetical protein C7S10_17075 [Nocardioides currus]|uniref:Sensor-like histidine kinase SenX3 n=1 Tax=Nocardioides currus TaxID=2133958 RepID=A0A2R7YTT2_9ACTN|nr:hypothetical protein C7S10_17075 [Nocardioides currus]
MQVLAEGAAALAGFGEAAVSVRQGDFLEVVATYGDGTSAMIGTQISLDVLQGELDKSEQWGVLHFVPGERVGDEMLAYSHIAHHEVPDAPDAWDPLDLLISPLLDDAGEIRGLLAVDSPVNGLRPGAAQQAALTSYAGVARTQVLLALEREELQTSVRLSAEVREVVRAALGEDSLDKVVEASRTVVAECFDAVGMWLSAFDPGGGAASAWWSHYGYELPMLDELDELAVRLAHLFWERQEVVQLTREQPDHPGLAPADVALVSEFLDRMRLGSALFVPLGAGPECLGYLALTRVVGMAAWSEMERAAALDIAHDLGRAIANARQLEQQRGLVDRLRELDRYRTELMNTVAHELRSPLASVSGYLELIEEEDLSVDVRRSVEAATRGAGRLEAVVEDLLAVAHVSDPDAEFDPVPVDLREVIAAVVDECCHVASTRSIALSIDDATDALVVQGQAEDLHRLFANLVSNAVKYSHEDSSVRVVLSRHEQDAVVEVVDQGLGISEEDQHQLFKEFFRSNNPEARSRPGTGLGLVIVDRLVRRHAGVLSLTSALGHGTTVTVRLPAAS